MAVLHVELVYFEIAIGKRGVRESVSKRKERLLAGVLVATITNKDAFFVDNLLLPLCRVIALMRGIIFLQALESNRKPPRRIDRAK